MFSDFDEFRAGFLRLCRSSETVTEKHLAQHPLREGLREGCVAIGLVSVISSLPS